MSLGRRLVRAVAIGLAAGATVLALPSGATGQGAGERIRSYDVGIEIEGDGSLRITEQIDYEFDGLERHGIFRDVLVRLTYDSRFDRVYPVEVISVEGSAGTPAEYRIEHQGSLLRIRIGDPDTTITGRHTYTITYGVEGALNGFPDHDELYWNVIGPYWEVPIDRASVQVAGPADMQRIACFAGPFGSNLPCTRNDLRGNVAVFEQGPLGPLEGLTVVAGFPRGVFPDPQPILEERWSLARAFSATPATIGGFAVLFALFAAGLGWLFWTRGRDRRAVGSAVDVAFGRNGGPEQAVPLFESATLAVEYAPPEGIRPGQVGTLIDEMVHPLDVTATIVDLAVRGYLRIEEIPKRWLLGKPDWHLVKTKEADTELLGYEHLLFEGLFQDAEPREEDEDANGRASEGDNGRASEGEQPGLAEIKLSSLKKRFATRLARVRRALYEDATERRWFSGRPDRIRQRWAARGWALFAGGGLVTGLLAWKTHFALIPLPVEVAGLALVAGAHWMPRRTAKGTGMVRRVLGFRMYIDTAEASEMQFQERENIFSRYLPYAVVFGLTQKWARAFAGLDGELPAASWYVGSGPLTFQQFSSSLEGFAVTAAGTITSTPGGSGSSGFSGGSSGGGGGGGGGGSW